MAGTGMNPASPWQLFSASAEEYPNNPFLMTENSIITYREMYRLIEEARTFLKTIPGRTCGLYLPNSSSFIVYLFAMNSLGRIVVPLSFQLKGISLYERINFAELDLLVTDETGYRQVQEYRDKIQLNQVILLTDGLPRLITFTPVRWNEQEFPDGLFGIFFTSGTASSPKGVLITGTGIAGNAGAVAECLGVNSRDRVLIARSIAQAGPIAGELLMAVSRGASLVFSAELFHPAIVLKVIKEYKITTVLFINTMLSLLLDYPGLESSDVSSLKRIIFGGMIVSRPMVEDTLSVFPNIDLYNTYGLTEAGTRVTFTRPDEIGRFPTSVGRPLPGCRITIYMEDGREAIPGETGVFCIRSEYLMAGYYKNSRLTEQTLTAHGLMTNDLGFCDVNGLYYVQARRDNVIIQGGNNIFPAEIEAVLARHPGVKEVVVMGIPDKKLGELVAAVIVPGPGFSLKEEGLMKWCRNNLEDRKVPRKIRFIDKLPRTLYNKIDINRIKEIFTKDQIL